MARVGDRVAQRAERARCPCRISSKPEGSVASALALLSATRYVSAVV